PGQNPADAPPPARAGDDARVAAELDHPPRGLRLHGGLEGFETSERAPVVAGPDGPSGLDRDHEPTARDRRVPRRRDDEPSADPLRGEVDAPRLVPVLVGERDHAHLALVRRREAELAQSVEIIANALFEGARARRLREERAEA